MIPLSQDIPHVHYIHALLIYECSIIVLRSLYKNYLQNVSPIYHNLKTILAIIADLAKNDGDLILFYWD